jgi:hypothetical protein
VKLPTAPPWYFLRGETVKVTIALSMQISAEVTRLPCSSRGTRYSVHWRYLALVDRNFGEVTRLLVPLQRMGTDCGHVDFTAKITRQVTEMGPLLDDRASAEDRYLINDMGWWKAITSWTYPTSLA